MSRMFGWSNSGAFRLQPPGIGGGMPAAGGGSSSTPAAPGMGGGMPNPAGNSGGYVPAGGMPPAGGGVGAGGESVDTGGLPSGPEGGAGGGPSPFHYNPITNTTNNRTYNTTTNNRNISTYRGGDRDYSRTYNQQKTNIDNSQTTMAARGGQQRQKIERMRPFRQKDYGMGEQMIGNPGLAMQQLKMMNSLMGLG